VQWQKWGNLEKIGFSKVHWLGNITKPSVNVRKISEITKIENF